MRERARHGSWARVGDRFADLLRELGRRWRQGEWTILEEHAASEALLRGIARCSESIPVPPGAPVCLLAAAVGEEHTLPLFLAELCLRECGWQAQWSGRSTPTVEILAAIAKGHLKMVALSSSGAESQPGDLARQARELEESCEQHGVTLVLGGSGAWPRNLSHARRPERFVDFHALLIGGGDTIPARQLAEQRHDGLPMISILLACVLNVRPDVDFEAPFHGSRLALRLLPFGDPRPGADQHGPPAAGG